MKEQLSLDDRRHWLTSIISQYFKDSPSWAHIWKVARELQIQIKVPAHEIADSIKIMVDSDRLVMVGSLVASPEVERYERYRF